MFFCEEAQINFGGIFRKYSPMSVLTWYSTRDGRKLLNRWFVAVHFFSAEHMFSTSQFWLLQRASIQRQNPGLPGLPPPMSGHLPGEAGLGSI